MGRFGVNEKGFDGEARAVRPAALTTLALFGATAIVAQVLLLRECLVVVAGNELFIALFFGCWFIGIAAGAAIGSFWTVREERLRWIVPALLTLQVVLLPALMIALRGVRARWGLPAWQLMPFLPLLRLAAEHLSSDLHALPHDGGRATRGRARHWLGLCGGVAGQFDRRGGGDVCLRRLLRAADRSVDSGCADRG
jgi:hypothetical protein